MVTKTLKVSTHDLVNHPACKASRDKLYGGVQGVITTRRMPKGLIVPSALISSRDYSTRRNSPRTIAEAVQQTGRDYNQFYGYLGVVQRAPSVRESKMAYQEMIKISKQYSQDDTLRNKLEEVRRGYSYLTG